MENSSEIDDFLKKHFTSDELSKISSYEKMRYFNMKKNYEMMISLGLKAKFPKFLRHKVTNRRAKSCGKFHKSKGNKLDQHLKPVIKQENYEKIQNVKTTEHDFSEKNNSAVGKAIARKDEIVNSNADVERAHWCSPQRNISKKCYNEKDSAIEDEFLHDIGVEGFLSYVEFLYCGDCGQEYDSPCPEHGPMMLIVNTEVPAEDDRAQQRPQRTLPGFLSVDPSSIEKTKVGVWTATPLPARVVFGPYEGRVFHEHGLARKSGHSRQIWRKDCVSNWLPFVNCAEVEGRRNLIAFRRRNQIFYRTTEAVQAHVELLVWYGDLDLNTGPGSSGVECHRCHVCGHQFTDADTLRRHATQHIGDRPHSCNVCSKTFKQMKTLKNHHRIHTGERPYTCSDCYKAFRWVSGLRKHQRSVHAGIKDYCCKTCKKFFTSRRHLQQHEKSVHSVTKAHARPTCEETFGDRTSLLSHDRSVHHENKAHSYQSCGKTFARSCNLMKHERSVHSESKHRTSSSERTFDDNGNLPSHENSVEIRPHTSHTSKKIFDDNGKLPSHEDSVFSEIRPHTSHTSEKTFDDNGNLSGHEDSVFSESKPYTSPTSEKTFDDNENLSVHEDSVHPESKAHTTPGLKKTFDDNGNLSGHEDSVHPESKAHTSPAPKKTFKDHGNLQNKEGATKSNRVYQLKHDERAVHSKTKSRTCQTCWKKFSSSYTLRQHENEVHSGQRRHECPQCGRNFTRLRSLIDHEASLHTGVFPHRCPLCEKGFVRPHYVKIHVLKEHGKK